MYTNKLEDGRKAPKMPSIFNIKLSFPADWLCLFCERIINRKIRNANSPQRLGLNGLNKRFCLESISKKE